MSSKVLTELGIPTHASWNKRQELILEDNRCSKAAEIPLQVLTWQTVEVILRDKHGVNPVVAQVIVRHLSKLNREPMYLYCANDVEIEKWFMDQMSGESDVALFNKYLDIFSKIMLSEYGFTWNIIQSFLWIWNTRRIPQE